MAVTQRSTTPGEVAQTILSELLAKIANTGSGNCYISDDPEELAPVTQSEFALVLTPRHWTFDLSDWEGHPTAALVTLQEFVVTVHRLTPAMDMPGRAGQTLFDAALGLYPVMTNVLGALSGNPLFVGAEAILAQGLRPDNGTWAPGANRQNYLQQNFEAKYSWEPGSHLPEVWP